MALVDIRQGDHSSSAKVSCVPAKIVRLERTHDCKTTNVTSGNILQMIHIPAGCALLDAALTVHRVEGGTLTVDVGLYTHSDDAAIDADGLLDGADLNSAAVIHGVTPGVLTYPYKNASDVAMDVSVLFNNTADNARFTLAVTVLDMGDTLVDGITNAG